jgi:hypothetical protein
VVNAPDRLTEADERGWSDESSNPWQRLDGARIAGAVGLTACRDDHQSSSDTEAGSSSDPTDGGSTGMVPADAPTWHADIAPIVSQRCSRCHHEGGVAPFPFTDYASTAPLAEAIAATVQARSMPPWGAEPTDSCTPIHAFKDDISLSGEQISLLQAWASAGAPEGDPDLAVERPAPPETTLPTVDQTLSMQTEVAIDGDRDEFSCFSFDPGLTQERYFNGL